MCYSLLPIPWCTRAEYGQVASRLAPGRPVTKPTNHTPRKLIRLTQPAPVDKSRRAYSLLYFERLRRGTFAPAT